MKKTKNPVAKALRSPHLRQRIVRDKTRYTRKGRKPRGSCPSDFLGLGIVCL